MKASDYKKIVFICSPLSGEKYEQNIENAKKYCRYVMLNEEDAIAFASHVFFTQFLNDANEAERKLGIEGGLEILKAADEVYVFKTNGEISEGMKKELEFAEDYGKKIYEFNKEECERILSKI